MTSTTPIDNQPKVLPQSSSPPVHSIRALTDAFPFYKGDVLQARVIEKLNHHEVLLATHDSVFPAESDVSLVIGETLQLKVESTRPKIILSLVPSPDDPLALVKNHLALFRSAPQGILNVVENGLAVLREDLQSLLPFVGKAEVDGLHLMLTSLVFSEKSLDNPLFFKEFLFNIGYMIEETLRKSVKQKVEEDHLGLNLKSLLLRLSLRLHLLLSDRTESDSDPQVWKALNRLANYADSSLDTLYNQQVVNVIGQEEDQGYYFQIPMKYSQDMRMADIFINMGDGSENKTKRIDSFQIVLFLNMDALGDMMIDVKYHERKIWGTFKCCSSESCTFIHDALAILNERLALSGYGPNHFHVQRSSDLLQEKKDFMQGRIIFSKAVINCFA